MDKQTLIKNFSRYANTYDRYADIQKVTAIELLAGIKENNYSQILEIGCGTGNYTALLKDKFKDATLIAIDISAKMIELAKARLKHKKVEFIIADGEDIVLDKEFDLITSNACFQWFDDLEKALLKYKELLKKEGLISFSIFGPQTFWELDASLKYILKGVSIEANNFITKEKLKKIMHKNFKSVNIKEARYTETFLNLKGLLNKIKYTGIRGNGLGNKIYFSQRFLKKIEEVYMDKFSAANRGGSANYFGGKQIKATYQAIFCWGTVE